MLWGQLQREGIYTCLPHPSRYTSPQTRASLINTSLEIQEQKGRERKVKPTRYVKGQKLRYINGGTIFQIKEVGLFQRFVWQFSCEEFQCVVPLLDGETLTNSFTHADIMFLKPPLQLLRNQDEPLAQVKHMKSRFCRYLKHLPT